MTTMELSQLPTRSAKEVGRINLPGTQTEPKSAMSERDDVSNEHLSWEKECQKVLASYFDGPLND